MIHTDVIVIGAGVAGLSAAKSLRNMGLSVVVMEKADTIGGHVAQWHKCFPFDMTGEQIVDGLRAEGVEIRTGISVDDIRRDGRVFRVADVEARAVVVATGFDLFNAQLKEELGYGVYPRVLTSADLEECFRMGRMPFDVSDADSPRFAVVHCVGSRDLKCAATHCSKVCCMAGVKAAIELKRLYPTAQVTNYYMDLRMFDMHYEELYHTAQTLFNVQFVRGRISEVSMGNQGRVKLKSEDTLLGIPLSDRVHGVVLMIGMRAGSAPMVDGQPMASLHSGFVSTADHLNASLTPDEGIFVCGACKGPRTITESIAEGRAAAVSVVEYLREHIMTL